MNKETNGSFTSIHCTLSVWQRDLADLFTGEFGYEKEMVVVDPDEVSWLVDRGNTLGKGAVGGFISFKVQIFGDVFGRDILP